MNKKKNNYIKNTVKGPVSIISLNRPDYSNAQNGAMTYQLDDAFRQAMDDDNVKVIAGPFIDFTGNIEEVNDEKQKVKVVVSIFGRPTSVELDCFQVEHQK